MCRFLSLFCLIILRTGIMWDILKNCKKQTSVCCCCSVMPDSLWPHGLYSPPGSSAHGVLQARVLEWVPFPSPGIFLTQGSNLRLLWLLYWQVDFFFLPLSHLGRLICNNLQIDVAMIDEYWKIWKEDKKIENGIHLLYMILNS